MLSWRKKTPERSAGGFGPLVAPETTTRPPGSSALSECDQVASPTVSITAWTRRQPGARLEGGFRAQLERGPRASPPTGR